MAFKPRLTKPESGNPYYNTKGNGGYSPCIKGKPTDRGCDVLSNCVGYAVGRFNEIGNYGSCKYARSTNAENFVEACKAQGLTIGNTPKLGAIIVWMKGATLDGSDGAGHVAIVEQINADGSIVTSESGWNSSAFWTKTRTNANGRWGAGSGYTFRGFIYNPAVKETEEVPVAPDTQTTEVIYTVRKGDTLGSIANRYSTTYQVIAAYNGIANPNLIHVGQKIKIPIGKAPEKQEPEKQETVQEAWKPKVGDVVAFKGNTHYRTASAATGYSCKSGLAKITAIYPKGKHPYHLVAMNGRGSNVYGWVDANTIDIP